MEQQSVDQMIEELQKGSGHLYNEGYRINRISWGNRMQRRLFRRPGVPSSRRSFRERDSVD